MAKYCPKACSRLFAAAAFLAIGIVQVITGLILLRSKYSYLLSGPNFWTAVSNIVVGSLLGISATLWKTINKVRHAAKRNVLAALTCSAMILNGTTAAILVLGESNHLMSIHLESSAVYSSSMLAGEILAYAYAISICSPIACIAISLTFLTSLCFQSKAKAKRSLDFKSLQIENTSSEQKSWNYKLPQPDSQILRKALSETTSLQSDSSCSSSSVTPDYLPSHKSFVDSNLYDHETSVHPTGNYDHNIHRKNLSEESNHSRGGRVCFAGDSIPKTGFVEYPSGNVIERTCSLFRESSSKPALSPILNYVLPVFSMKAVSSSQPEMQGFPPVQTCTNALTPTTSENTTGVADVEILDASTTTPTVVSGDSKRGVSFSNSPDYSIPSVESKMTVSSLKNSVENTNRRPKFFSRLKKVKPPEISTERMAALEQTPFLTNSKQPRFKQNRMYHNYVDCNKQSELSSFKTAKKKEEMNGTLDGKNEFAAADSVVESTSELNVQETSDLSRPPAHSSGCCYLSTGEGSGDHFNLETNPNFKELSASSCSRIGLGRSSRKVKFVRSEICVNPLVEKS